jgi:hypothetical protein
LRIWDVREQKDKDTKYRNKRMMLKKVKCCNCLEVYCTAVRNRLPNLQKRTSGFFPTRVPGFLAEARASTVFLLFVINVCCPFLCVDPKKVLKTS